MSSEFLLGHKGLIWPEVRSMILNYEVQNIVGNDGPLTVSSRSWSNSLPLPASLSPISTILQNCTQARFRRRGTNRREGWLRGTSDPGFRSYAPTSRHPNPRPSPRSLLPSPPFLWLNQIHSSDFDWSPGSSILSVPVVYVPDVLGHFGGQFCVIHLIFWIIFLVG
jgi:hypothetical protein